MQIIAYWHSIAEWAPWCYCCGCMTILWGHVIDKPISLTVDSLTLGWPYDSHMSNEVTMNDIVPNTRTECACLRLNHESACVCGVCVVCVCVCVCGGGGGQPINSRYTQYVMSHDCRTMGRLLRIIHQRNICIYHKRNIYLYIYIIHFQYPYIYTGVRWSQNYDVLNSKYTSLWYIHI